MTRTHPCILPRQSGRIGSYGTNCVWVGLGCNIHDAETGFCLFLKKKILYRAERWSGEGGGEELRLQSQDDQELSADESSSQLILKMISEDQTVDHTNVLMGLT